MNESKIFNSTTSGAYVKPSIEWMHVVVEGGFAASVSVDGTWIEDPFMNTSDENIFNS